MAWKWRRFLNGEEEEEETKRRIRAFPFLVEISKRNLEINATSAVVSLFDVRYWWVGNSNLFLCNEEWFPFSEKDTVAYKS